jgi:hypothetical protein
MGILSRPRFLPQQRLDLEDINALLSALRTDSKLYTKQLVSQNNLVFKGFSVTGIGLQNAVVNMADATLIIPQNNNDFSWFTAAPAEPNITIPDSSLADGVRNYVEILLQTENNTPLTKAFWDPEANSGVGAEFNQIVETITDLKVEMVVSQGGFSGSPDRLPLCIIDVDGAGTIKQILDRRNLFGRLGTPANIDNRYSWASKFEPVYSLNMTAQSGTFVAGETINIGTETAKVITGGGASITFNAPSGINFFPGNSVTGVTSGATGTINTVSESFAGADKDLKTQKDINDALMTELAFVKGTRFWYQDAASSLTGIIKFLESILVQNSATAAFSWDGSDLSITDDNITPGNDTLGFIRIMGRGDDLALTREDGTGGTSKITVADGEVLYVKIPTTGNRTFSGTGVANTNFQLVDIASYVSSDETYWLAYREGTRLYVRGYGEMEPGETINIGDPELEDILAQIAANQVIANQDRTSKLIEGGTWSYIENSGSPVTIASVSLPSNGFVVIDAANKLIAQSFTPGSNVSLNQVDVQVRKAGSPVHDIRMKIYPDLAGEPDTLTLLGQSGPLSAAGLTTSFVTKTAFNMLSLIPLTSGQKYWLVLNAENITTLDAGNHVQSWYEGTADGIAGQTISTSNDNGSTWSDNPQGRDLNFDAFAAGVASNDLELSAIAYIQVPGIPLGRNTIQPQIIQLPNPTSVAYVNINRNAGANANLTVSVVDSASLVLNDNIVIVARKVTGGALVGSHSFLLKNGELLELDGALAEINRLLGQLKLKNHETDQQKVRITAADSSLLNGNTLSQMIGNFLLKFTGAQINFQTGVVTKEDGVTALGTNFTPFAIPSNQYFWYGVSLNPSTLDVDGMQLATVQVDLASSANASQSASLKPVITGEIKLGAIQIFNNAGTLEVVDVRPLGVGSGSGGGAGQGASFDAEIRSYLKLSPYEFATENIIAVDGDDNIDITSTGAYSPATKTFAMDVGETLISEELLDADFIAANRPLAKARILLRYAEGEVDPNPVVELSKNGGVYTAVVMNRIGNTDTFEGELEMSAAVGTSLLMRVTASAQSEVFAYAVFYDTTFVAIPLGLTKNVHTETFSGNDNLTTFTLPFIPDVRSLQVFDKRRGQVYVYSPNNVSFTVSGNNVIFSNNFFDYPGDTVELEFRQLEGNGFDNADQNAVAIAALQTRDNAIGDQLNGQGNFVVLSKIAAPFTTVENREMIPDFTNDLAPRMGVERIQFQEMFDLNQEFGPNGEVVKGLTNDKFNRVRFIGTWSSFANTAGEGFTTIAVNDYLEVTFYGTGLNILTNVDIPSRDIRASVDGGSEGSNLVFNGSAVLQGRNYNLNAAISAVSGLTPGVHTVKIRNNNAAGLGLFGIEILNETSQLFVNSGDYVSKGKRYSLGSRTGTSYNSGFDSGVLGTKGGCVSVYLKDDNTLGKAVNPTEANIQYLASANHTNEQIVRKYNFREFGKGRGDDFSIIPISFTNDSRAFTGEDGVTSLTGQNSGSYDLNGGVNGLGWGNATAEYVITFIGTGLDIMDLTNSLSGSNLNVFVDEVSAGTLAQIAGLKRRKIVSGLPYGTHTVRLQAGSPSPTDWVFQEIIIYAPKKPTIPSTAVELSNYFVMANYVQGNSITNVLDSTGVLHKTPNREFIYGGTWTVNGINPALVVGGHDIRTTVNSSFFEHTFFGTGFSLPIRGNVSTANITLTLDGSTNFTGLTVNQTASGTFVPATGVYTGAINDGHLGVSGLPLAKHTIRVTFNNAATVTYFAPGLQIITPIHAPKLVEDVTRQDAMDVGSESLQDLRDFSNKQLVETEKTLRTTGIADSLASTLNVFFPTYIKSTIYLEEEGEVDYKFDCRAFIGPNPGALIVVRLRLDGVFTSELIQTRQNNASFNWSQTIGFSRTIKLSKGFHTLQIWLANTDTVSAGSGFSNGILSVRKVTK